MTNNKPKRVRGAEEVWSSGYMHSGVRSKIRSGIHSTSEGGICSTNRSGLRRLVRHDVADRLHTAAIHLLRTVRQVDTQSGISPARLSALSVLVFAGPQSLRDLAQAELVTPPTMSKIVKGLESDGFVSRKAGRLDLRTIQLRATAKGKATLQRARRMRIDALTALLTATSKNELAILQQAAQIIEQAVSR